FVSSRRRHTRCYRDWSSDVCSSDLGAKRRLHRAQDEGMEQLHALETHPDDARRQRVEVGFDVGQLGHRAAWYPRPPWMPTAPWWTSATSAPFSPSRCPTSRCAGSPRQDG